MFLSDVATAAKQVFILYVLVLLGFICDRTKIYTEKAAKLTNDLFFYIVTPAIIIQSFSSVEMSGENVRGMLMSFLGGTILHVVAIVICIPFWRRTDKNLSCIYKYAAIYGNVGYMALGISHDTSRFVCDNIARVWEQHLKWQYPDAHTLVILCDGGGSNSSAHL